MLLCLCFVLLFYAVGVFCFVVIPQAILFVK